MRRLFVVLVNMFLTAVAGATGSPPLQCEQGPAIALTGTSCGSLAPPTLSCQAPAEVQGALSLTNKNTTQRAANIFSWQQFIALHWPAAPSQRGRPATGQSIDAAGPRVWETWKEDSEIYRANGQRPAAWNARQALPAACSGAGKVLHRTSKVGDVLDQTLQALPVDGSLPASLKDQQGRLVRYEIRLNKPMFDYIVKRRLYHGATQAKASHIDFPAGSQLVKAAWREVDGDEARHFVTTDACVCDSNEGDALTGCQVKRMGLAGLHLMTKTVAAPQWIWSTFEQVDNVTAIHPAVQPLNNPACTTCLPNKQTAGNTPTQLTRVIPIPGENPVCSRPDLAVDNVVQLNADLQKALTQARSTLANYQLINTQWAVSSEKRQARSVFDARPALLGNTTMESFSQNTSSCMGCHAMARSLKPDVFVSSDFSFTLNNARPRPKGTHCVNVEASESCSSAILAAPTSTAPASVQHGYTVATRTYETVGKPYVGNQLHCQSCHLNAGGNPGAAWWPGVKQRQGGLAGLQHRINGCFERSMNGQKLCDPGKPGDCEKNPHMAGLIALMEWQTAQFQRKNPGKQPASGFPGEQDAAFKARGDITRGQASYAQKCAFCHNSDGQGHYENGYFRPALWGNNSYNSCAGLAPSQGASSKLAAFLHANMPYTSGGLLTQQDAVDLAAFINSKPRPTPEICPK